MCYDKAMQDAYIKQKYHKLVTLTDEHFAKFVALSIFAVVFSLPAALQFILSFTSGSFGGGLDVIGLYYMLSVPLVIISLFMIPFIIARAIRSKINSLPKYSILAGVLVIVGFAAFPLIYFLFEFL